MNKVRPFEFHGFDSAGETEDHAFGNCVFCGNEDKFYINKETGQFDCKTCGEAGNVISFLTRLIKYYGKKTKKENYRKLSELRDIPLEVFKRFRLAWDGDRWLIPSFSETGTVRDIRSWTPGSKGMRSTAGCKVQLLNLDEVAALEAGEIAWICEGEWDAMILSWLLQTAKHGDAVCAVPGASTFKDDWVPFFEGKKVRLCYDNDQAGNKGRAKVLKLLKGVASEIESVEWDNDLPPGYDIRDFISERRGAENEPEAILEELNGLLTTEKNERETKERDRYEIWETSEEAVGASFEETVAVFRDRLEMSKDMEDALRIIYAHAFAVDVPGDPLWCYLVGPPGCGKTLLMLSLRGSERCRFHSTITPHALVSGFRAPTDPSILPTWDGHCAVLKDFTEVLATHPTAKEELYGTLRGAYDGHIKRSFGNGLVREYNLHFSMVAGVTPAIHGDKRAMMGERFIKYEMFRDVDYSADAEILAAINNVAGEDAIENELCEASGRFLSRKVDTNNLPGVGRETKMRIVALSQLISALRANVERNEYGDQRLLYRPCREIGTRLAKQLIKLGQMLAFVEGKNKIDYPVYQLMERVAFDTSIGFHFELVQKLMEMGGKATRANLARETCIPETTASRALEDLLALRVVGKTRAESGARGRPALEWFLSDSIQALWKRAKIGQPFKTDKAKRA